jgi:hypothetical protein
MTAVQLWKKLDGKEGFGQPEEHSNSPKSTGIYLISNGYQQGYDGTTDLSTNSQEACAFATLRESKKCLDK